MAAPALGFIGFGEAGSRMASGLREAGADAAGLAAFDIAAGAGEAGERIRRRAAEAAVALVDSSAALAARSSILFSVVTAAAAVDAARQSRPHLGAQHIYVDCNSVSPGTKREIAEVVEAGGARFVEAAIMAPVPKRQGHRVPMLLNGEAAPLLAETLGPLGFAFETMEAPWGAAVAVKMCRSIVIKGLEALLTECVLGASRLGVEERVFQSLQKSHPGIEWKALADYMVNRVVVHGERRAREMEEVAATLRAVGVEPIMAAAAGRRQDWAARLDLKARFGAEGPATYTDVLAVLAEGEI